MKKVAAIGLSLTVLSSATAFAEDAPAPVTRAEVRQDLIALEATGWRPKNGFLLYPDDMLAAERRVAGPEAARPRAMSGQATRDARAANGAS